MKKIWKLSACLAALVLSAGLLGGCSGENTEESTGNKTTEDSNQTNQKDQSSQYASSGEDQLAAPAAGDTIATFHIKDYGDIVVKLFSDGAPKAVENFTTHAKEGYYDGVIFHRVINDFMIQGGDPGGNGYGGESIWGKPFEDEFAENLMPIRGALCMANAGSNTNGSQFFIVQAKSSNLEYASYAGVNLTDTQKKMFEENGGYPTLVYKHTVFGQVTEGVDVLDAIAAARTDASDKPMMDVVIESIDITTQK